jgi:hypothetical protein
MTTDHGSRHLPQAHLRPISKLVRYETVPHALDTMDQALLVLAQHKYEEMPALLTKVRA